MEPIRWQAPEYTHYEKSSDWYWALGIVALSGAVTALILKNILFALFIIIAAFTVALFASRKPQLVHFELQRRGIAIDETLYPFNTLESFWIHEDEHGHHMLILKSERFFMPHIVIPLTQNIEMIHDTLSERLTEEEMQEPVSHKILEFFGF